MTLVRDDTIAEHGSTGESRSVRIGVGQSEWTDKIQKKNASGSTRTHTYTPIDRKTQNRYKNGDGRSRTDRIPDDHWPCFKHSVCARCVAEYEMLYVRRCACVRVRCRELHFFFMFFFPTPCDCVRSRGIVCVRACAAAAAALTTARRGSTVVVAMHTGMERFAGGTHAAEIFSSARPAARRELPASAVAVVVRPADATVGRPADPTRRARALPPVGQRPNVRRHSNYGTAVKDSKKTSTTHLFAAHGTVSETGFAAKIHPVLLREQRRGRDLGVARIS